MARVAVTDDYYAILEVPEFASLETIRESYKRLALKFHPDKNKDRSATSNFQSLSVAWETLKDASKRTEYDKNYVGIAKRKRESVEDETRRAKKRWEEVERKSRSQWTDDESWPEASTRSADEIRRKEKAEAWQAIARDDYLARVQTWIEFRKLRSAQCRELQHSIHQQEMNLKAQEAEDKDVVTQRFQDAIKRSSSSGRQIDDHSAILARLLEARNNYIARLAEAVADSRRQLEELIVELEVDRQRHEEEEGRARALRVTRALELLGPRNLSGPLFSLIDRRGKAINCWKALSRIKPAARFPASLSAIEEGPWHLRGDWERVSGEQTCGRCGQSAFHLIPECGPAQCPGCGMIACIDCHRSLMLLQEYEDWITSPLGTLKQSLFSVVFSSEPNASKESSSASAHGTFDT